MNKITFLFIGLLIGSLTTYFIIKLNAPEPVNNLIQEQNAINEKALGWINKSTVETEIAAKQFAKYAERADNMYKGTMNTRYLNLPFEYLTELIEKYKRENKANGLRIYPMIYTNSAQVEKRNLLNILILPVFCSDTTTWQNDKITELISNNPQEDSVIVSLSEIDNEIGQCPPPIDKDCDYTGSVLLKYSASRYANRNGNRWVWRVITD